VLAVVRERPGVTAGELAAASGVSGGTLYGLLRRLVEQGELAKRELPRGQTGYTLAGDDSTVSDEAGRDAGGQASPQGRGIADAAASERQTGAGAATPPDAGKSSHIATARDRDDTDHGRQTGDAVTRAAARRARRCPSAPATRSTTPGGLRRRAGGPIHGK
jgi:hypothetical protein